MAKGVLGRFLRHPVSFTLRALRKVTLDRWRYGRGGDYEAEAYWRDRFAKYGASLRGPGDEGLSEAENAAMYREAGRVFLELCRREGVDLPRARVLEVGCGTGFYTRILAAQGVRDYTGVDITDVQFPRLREEFPGFRFVRGDICAARPEGVYDLVVMIDVVEHIVDDAKFARAMDHVGGCVAESGVLVVAPIAEADRQTAFYVRLRPLAAFREAFAGFELGEPVPFRGLQILPLRRPASQAAQGHEG